MSESISHFLDVTCTATCTHLHHSPFPAHHPQKLVRGGKSLKSYMMSSTPMTKSFCIQITLPLEIPCHSTPRTTQASIYFGSEFWRTGFAFTFYASSLAQCNTTCTACLLVPGLILTCSFWFTSHECPGAILPKRQLSFHHHATAFAIGGSTCIGIPLVQETRRLLGSSPQGSLCGASPFLNSSHPSPRSPSLLTCGTCYKASHL